MKNEESQTEESRGEEGEERPDIIDEGASGEGKEYRTKPGLPVFLPSYFSPSMRKEVEELVGLSLGLMPP